MDKLDWCKDQKQGIKLIEPNDNLADEYYRNAEESMRILNKIKNTGSNMWLATHKYYVEYFAAYSLLMKIGIKSEIHSCTIQVIKLLESKKIIGFKLSDRLSKSKDIRIKNQYYLKNIHVSIKIRELSNLLLDIKDILDKISDNQIQNIRDILS